MFGCVSSEQMLGRRDEFLPCMGLRNELFRYAGRRNELGVTHSGWRPRPPAPILGSRPSDENAFSTEMGHTHVILASQALTLAVPSTEIIVATSNVSHLSRFVPADLWTNIVP